ncbi:MAG: efflux RND transporter periplasmic adaptor subunit [Candidatus Saccharicenans sp.]
MPAINLKSKKYLLIFLLAAIINFSCGTKKELTTTQENQPDVNQTPSRVHLTPEALKTAGIEISELSTIKIQRQLEVPGEVVFNPKNYYRLASRLSGRVEELLAYEGNLVKKGQVVARLFSLQFMEAITELRLAAERLKKIENLDQEDKTAALSVLNSARQKLRILGLEPGEIDHLINISASNEDINLYPVTSPLEGQVIATRVLTGDNVEAGALLMEIADLKELWVEVRIQEKDISLIQSGEQALVRVNAFPEESFTGQITYISPLLDSSTRTIKARIIVNNKNGHLRPGMYAEASILIPETSCLAISEEAVQEIGGKTVVFMPQTGGDFAIREIKIGHPINGKIPVLAGLSAGERYVSHGSFILKSEMLKNVFGEE